MTSTLRSIRSAAARVPLSIILVGVVIVVIVAAAGLAPWVAPFDPNQQSLLSRLKPPARLGETTSTTCSERTISGATCIPAFSTEHAPR